ncbi:MAG: NADH-quinone oxidoreductase subunit C [bacterium]
MSPSQLNDRLPGLLGDALISRTIALGEVACEIEPSRIVEVCVALRDDPDLRFASLIDLCGVDYGAWGESEAIETGIGGPSAESVVAAKPVQDGTRFAVVYHLLSLQRNVRLRLRVSSDDDAPSFASVTEVWPAANWYEREAFDLFGILFDGHPDLRRLLTDYGFIGHPFRKDFPLSGEVEMRYDEAQGRVIYQPVTIEPRTLVPRTIGEDAFGAANRPTTNGGEDDARDG